MRYKWVFIFIGIFFFVGGDVFADIPSEEFTECESMVSTANVISRNNYITKTSEFFNLIDYSGVAKSQELDTFDRVYTCEIKSICEAIKSKNSEEIILDGIIGCTPLSVEKLEKKLSVKFDSCRKLETNVQREQIWNRCEAMVTSNIRGSRIEVSQNFQSAVSVENQGNLGAKILSIQQRMAVLFEKTRQFSYHFIKVINDIGCTLPGKSFP